MSYNIVIIEPGYASYEIEEALLGPLGAKLKPLDWQNDRQKLMDGVQGADLLMLRDTRIDRELLASVSGLKGVVRYGVGVDKIDLVAARELGIPVANVPDYGAEIEVADHTLALFLAVRRRTVTRDRDVRQGAWEVGQKEPMRRISGSVLGLIGYGRIGRAVARRFAAFGVTDVVVHDPFLSADAAAKAGVRLVSLPELAASADIVSLHAPGSADGAPTIDAAFIAAMRPGAMLVNTARGTHIDEAALIKALVDGKIAGAGLDVFRNEPPSSDNPLFALPNVVVSDHTGWYSEESVRQIQLLATGEAKRMLTGERPENWVNPW